MSAYPEIQSSRGGRQSRPEAETGRAFWLLHARARDNRSSSYWTLAGTSVAKFRSARHRVAISLPLAAVLLLTPFLIHAADPIFPYGAVYCRKSNPPEQDWERDHKTAAQI